MGGIKRILNRLMALHNETIRRELVELFLEQTCNIINAIPYCTDPESIHLSPSCFLGFKNAPDILWTREIEGQGKIGKAMGEILSKLKNWHLSNLKRRDEQIRASTSKFLVVRQSPNKSSHIPPNVGDIVSLYTTENQRHLGQIVSISRQSAKVLCQDKIYSQPLSFLTPLFTEIDQEGKCPPLNPTDSSPGLGLDDEFDDMPLEMRNQTTETTST